MLAHTIPPGGFGGQADEDDSAVTPTLVHLPSAVPL